MFSAMYLVTCEWPRETAVAEVSGYAVGAIFFQYQLREKQRSVRRIIRRAWHFDRRCRALSVSAGGE